MVNAVLKEFPDFFSRFVCIKTCISLKNASNKPLLFGGIFYERIFELSAHFKKKVFYSQLKYLEK